MARIIVMMSSYNGAKYIKEQIESVLNQMRVDVELWIRDDGSIDGTREYLEELRDRKIIQLELGENIGYRKSFMRLCHLVPQDADYYAFCDQDDVWKRDKLFKSVTAIGETSEPTIAISDLEFVDGHLNPINTCTAFPVNYSTIDSIQLKKLVAIETIVTGYGCTQVWNSELQRLVVLNKYETKYNHDYVLGILGIMCGRFIVIPEKLIYYRQHGNNTSGARTGFERVLTIAKRHIETITGNRKDPISDVDRNMLECYGHLMDQQSREILGNVVKYKDSFRNKLCLVLGDYCRGLAVSDRIKTKLKILLGVL